MQPSAPNTESQIPYLPLSGYYFFYFAAVGIILPFLGLYFQSLGLSAIEIAQLLAVLSFARIVSPPIWALLADRRGNFLFYVQLASWLSAGLVLGLWWLDDFWSLFGLMAWLGFFWHAALPPMESLTLSHLGSQLSRYSRIRLWGSVGFIVAVLGAGWLIEMYGQRAFLLITTLFFMATALIAQWNRESPQLRPAHVDWSGLGSLLRQSLVWWVLVIALLSQTAHGIYYSFYSILLADAGYSNSSIGLLWSLGVVAEIILFWFFWRIAPVLRFHHWLLIAMGLSVARWGVIGFFVESLSLMVLAQLLHAATFAVFHSVVVQWLHQTFVGHQAQGQALYVSFSYGIGGVLGSLIAGYAWTQGGGEWTFGLAALVSLLGFGFVWKVKQASETL